jgi:alcohol dehydrogenase class IV
LAQFSDECRSEGHKRILLIYTTPLKPQAEAIAEALVREMGSAEACFLLEYAYGEPTIAYFRSLLEEARRYGPDCVAGLGGGSVLDTAKLLAALWNNAQDVVDVFGKNLLTGRKTGLICIPTTSGTGSEVSPNAILLDEETGEKKAVISPALVPDSCFIDPALMAGLPPNVTAETGMDALSHCIEAYTNRFSHPLVDVYALAGIRLIGSHLERAYREPSDMEARAALAMGSLYGGLCLGPVNTAAVHALSYGLGGQYHVSHGLANAMLLPTVMRFNLNSNPQKYKDIGEALGAESALEGVERLSALSVACGIPQKLSDLGIAAEEVETLADLAMKVTRLLNNNPREVTREYAINLYKQLF